MLILEFVLALGFSAIQLVWDNHFIHCTCSQKIVLLTFFSLIEGELAMSDVGDTLLDVAIGTDHDFKIIDMPGGTGQETNNSVEVSAKIDVQQEPRKLSYSNIFLLQLYISIN